MDLTVSKYPSKDLPKKKLLDPFFTVILPTYNREKFIRKAVQSVLNQAFESFELIVIDDASTDNTNAIIGDFDDDRLIYLWNENNLERCESRNRGIKIAKGKYICFLDSDDYHLPNHLSTIYNEIKVKGFPKAMFFTNAWDEVAGERKERPCPDLEDYNLFQYIFTYTFNPQRWAVHREIIQEFKFDPAIVICEDLDTSARIATKYALYQIKQRTTVYVHHPESFTFGDSLKAFKELYYLKKIFKRPIIKDKLPLNCKCRLLSMCYFHIAIYQEKKGKKGEMYKNIIRSFFLYPNGYNGKTNKILLVLFLYNLPIGGSFLKFLVRTFK